MQNTCPYHLKPFVAFCGIANPLIFNLQAEKLGHKNIDTLNFSDHHNYSKRDFDEIIGDAFHDRLPDVWVENKVDSVKIVTTEKDYSRMNEKQKQSCDYIEVDLEIENKNEFINLIKNKI